MTGQQKRYLRGLAHALKPVVKDGTVTLGGQTHPADGNAAIIVTSPDKARELSADKNKKNNISVDLKYNQGIPVIKEITRISKPGRRVYTKADSIPRIQNGLGIAIMSTSKGIMTDNDARKENLGGEILCKVF